MYTMCVCGRVFVGKFKCPWKPEEDSGISEASEEQQALFNSEASL